MKTDQSNEIPQKAEKLYEGKAKIIYATADPDLAIQYFKDDASAFNAKKKGTIREKGIVNNAVSSRIFEFLGENGVRTHFVKKLSEREMLVQRVSIIPVEVVMRNVVAGSLAKRMGIPEGKKLPKSILEFYYKDDALDDPMINEYHMLAFSMAVEEEIAKIKEAAQMVNGLLTGMFDKVGIDLVDFKLEFGRSKGGILLADEISPDSCRLWDQKTGEKMDKDRFRFDLGKVEESYGEIARRIGGV
ncbi:MAG: phosphoribosylaminoimidazole-succinocarboxamide synthase [bacterium]|nr:MAG: phosphoribosylaminoimidazole-succinocarboxamide synthase [bacterium]